MRVSTLGLHKLGLSAILRQQSALADTQLQVSTGRRYQRASEDPISAARELDLNRSLGRLEQLQRNADVATHRLGLEDNALGELTDTLQRVRELALLANNDANNDDAGDFIGAELDELLNQLVQVGNSSDGEGGYLFGGYVTGRKPFIREGAQVAYYGDQGRTFLQVGPSRRIQSGDSGAEVFQQIKAGNGTFVTNAATTNTGQAVIETGSVVDATQWIPDDYEIVFVTASDYEVRDSGGVVVSSGTYEDSVSVSFRGVEVTVTGTPAAGDTFTVSPARHQDMFTTVQNFIDALNAGITSEGDRAILHSAVNSVLADVDRALDHVSVIRTRVGNRLNAVDDQVGLNADTRLALQATLSDVREIDLVDAAARMDLQMLSLQAAQQAFATGSDLTLFNFIR